LDFGAQHERELAVGDGRGDVIGQVLAGAADGAPVAGRRIALVQRLDHPRADVAVVVHGVAEAGDSLAQLRVADRRRAHVDAAASRAEVERGPDHADRRPVAPR